MNDSSERAGRESFRENADSAWSGSGLATSLPRLPRESGPGQLSQSSNLVRLVRTIEAEVIPRLVLARRIAGTAPLVRALGVPSQDEVAELGRLVLIPDSLLASSFVTTLRDRGASLETLYLDLLAPTARHLGDLWSEDLCDFTEVTAGLGRLQHVLHELSPAFRNEVPHHEQGRRVLLLPLPGEQHTFGLLMVIEFFRRAGWDVWSGPVDTRPELTAMVRQERFAVVGLSISSDRQLDHLASIIRLIRRASRNRAIGVMVGGPVFLEHPEMVALVGADATAQDGRQATRQARDLLALLPQPR